MTEKEAIECIDNILCDDPFGYLLISNDIEWLDKAKEALEKQIPMKPIYKEKTGIVHCSYADGTSGFKANTYEDYFCPVCDWVVGERYNHPRFKKGYHDQRKSKFCNECGQAIDWSEEE